MPIPVVILLLAACGEWQMKEDLDGDGFSKDDGDCWDYPQGPALTDALGQEVSLSGASINPEATERWYDGVDQNCDGMDDYDQDGDGHALFPAGDDCFDYIDQPGVTNPAGVAPESVHPSDEAGTIEEVWYDGLDGDCDGNDGDQDGDGFWATDYSAQAGVALPMGATGGDCDDADASAYPGAVEDLSTDVDEDCDGQGCDGDGDGVQGCGGPDCNDNDSSISQLESEIWHDGVDQNCDGNDDDEDGDGVGLGEGDCHDDPQEVFIELNGFANLVASDINPNATERWYDGIDQDCGEDSDFDQDQDGHGATLYGQGGDCDDEDAAVWPEATEFWYNGIDENCDGNDTDQDGDGEEYDLRGGTDCNDQDAAINEAATEACDGVDNDCDTSTDEQNASGCLDYLRDADGDGSPSTSESCLCTATGTYTVLASAGLETDCNDQQSDISPTQPEDCATLDDDNCSGDTNDQDADGCSRFYADEDEDGYGNAAVSGCFCEATLTYPETSQTDCDDASSEDFPGATELCNGDDEDCDGAADNGLTLYYPDSDVDGYGDETVAGDCDLTAVDEPVANNSDCDDGEPWVYPGAIEICDLQQNDCNQANWSDAQEDGLVTYFDIAGYPTNETWNTTLPSSVATYTIESPGVTVNVCRGTFYQAISMSLTGLDGVQVVGLYGYSQTTLSGAGGFDGPLIDVGNSQGIVVQGLSLIGAAGSGSSYGGAVRVATSSAEQGSASNPNLTLEDCLVSSNADTAGAAIAVGRSGSTTQEYGYLVLYNTLVANNSASTYGGGAWILNGTLECIASGAGSGGFSLNSAGLAGGAVYLDDNLATLTSTGTLISDGCDWGTGASNNTPSDIAGYGMTSANYSSNANFTCTISGGCL